MELSELVSRVKAGDKEALSEIVRIYGGDVYARALNQTKSSVIAQQVTRQMIAELIEKLKKHPGMDGWELFLETLSEKNLAVRALADQQVRLIGSQLESSLPGDDSVPIYTAAPDAAAPGGDFRDAFSPAPAAKAAPSPSRPVSDDSYTPPDMPPRDSRAGHAPEASLSRAQARGDRRPAPAALRERPAPENPPLPSDSLLPRRRKESVFGRAVGVFLLTAVCLLLLWFIAGLLMRMSILPPVDLGYVWFNENVFLLF